MPLNAKGDYHMNPAHGKLMEGIDKQPASDVKKETGQHHAPSIHIHSHAKGHTVHILYKDGGHEKHEHGHGDAEGIASHIHKHLGGGNSSHEADQFGSESLLDESGETHA